MKALILLLLTSSSYALDLKVGDLLLQPLHCRLCNLIEGETQSKFSHIGIVLQVHPQVYVGEAFQEVRKVTLKEFLRKTQNKQSVQVVRPRGNFRGLKKLFYRNYLGKPYDSHFLWDNQKHYCSELTWKLLRHFTNRLPRPRPMTFQYQRQDWKRYFKGRIPDGKRGIAPAHFERFKGFKTIGEL